MYYVYDFSLILQVDIEVMQKQRHYIQTFIKLRAVSTIFHTFLILIKMI
jgi:hypothetical protein